MPQVDDKAPEIDLVDDRGERFVLSRLRGERVLVVFYPGDDTPVCTAQLCDYRDGIEAFEGVGVRVVGISADDGASHRRFREKYDLPFTLLSDPGLAVARAWGCKGMLGMKRAVFLVDRDGVVRYAHVEALPIFRRRRDELLEAIRGLGEA